MAAKRITDMLAATTLSGAELVEVSQPSATVKVTATTLSALAADNSYNDSANGFVAAGFAVNDRVVVTGFTGNVANNILVGIITVLTAGKMTIGGTDGDVIVDDAAGESVTIAKWVTARATLSNVVALGLTRVIPFFVTTAPTASEVLAGYVAVNAFTLPANLAGSQVKKLVGGTNPTLTFAIDIQRNGVSIATISVANTGVVTLTTSGGTSKAIAIGDVLTFIAPVAPDATFVNWAVNLLGAAA